MSGVCSTCRLSKSCEDIYIQKKFRPRSGAIKTLNDRGQRHLTTSQVPKTVCVTLLTIALFYLDKFRLENHDCNPTLLLEVYTLEH